MAGAVPVLALGHQIARLVPHLPLAMVDEVVLGILDDKPYEAMLKYLVPGAAQIIITRAKIERSLPPSTLEQCIKTMSKAKLTIIDDVGEAVLTAIDSSAPEDTVCVAGSLYVVGEARKKIIDSFPTEDLT